VGEGSFFLFSRFCGEREAIESFCGLLFRFFKMFFFWKSRGVFLFHTRFFLCVSYTTRGFFFPCVYRHDLCVCVWIGIGMVFCPTGTNFVVVVETGSFFFWSCSFLRLVCPFLLNMYRLYIVNCGGFFPGCFSRDRSPIVCMFFLFLFRCCWQQKKYVWVRSNQDEN